MSDQIKRFERWRQKLPADTAFLVTSVCEDVIPIFIHAGYVRLAEYGGRGNLDATLARCIVLQRQSGTEWPTVEIRFADLGRPFLIVDFAWLPETCRRWKDRVSIDIPRVEALVSEGYVFLRLMRNRHRSNDSKFGISRIWPTLRPLAKLQRETEELQNLCNWLVNLLSHDMPTGWGLETTPSRVDPHAWRQWGAIALFRKQQNSV
jgi:hypothetical protein